MKRSVIRPLLAIVGSVALVMSFAGCGSDDKLDDALSADEFKTQVNAICKTGNVELAKVFAKVTATSTKEEKNAIAREAAALIKKQGEDIDALAEPKDLSADVTAMIAALNAGVASAEEKGAAAMSADADTFKNARDKATVLGLADCGAE